MEIRSGLPQAWEGVHELAADREGWLLSLDERAWPHRDVISAVGYYLMQATLVGNPAPMVKRIRDRMRAPRPGDFVFEPSMATHPHVADDTRISATGILLVGPRREWAHTDEEWLGVVGRQASEYLSSDGPWVYDLLRHPERPVESSAWYVQRGPAAADITRWTNCQFEALPTTWRAWEDDMVTPMGSSVVLA